MKTTDYTDIFLHCIIAALSAAASDSNYQFDAIMIIIFWNAKLSLECLNRIEIIYREMDRWRRFEKIFFRCFRTHSGHFLQQRRKCVCSRECIFFPSKFTCLGLLDWWRRFLSRPRELMRRLIRQKKSSWALKMIYVSSGKQWFYHFISHACVSRNVETTNLVIKRNILIRGRLIDI